MRRMGWGGATGSVLRSTTPDWSGSTSTAPTSFTCSTGASSPRTASRLSASSGSKWPEVSELEVFASDATAPRAAASDAAASDANHGRVVSLAARGRRVQNFRRSRPASSSTGESSVSRSGSDSRCWDDASKSAPVSSAGSSRRHRHPRERASLGEAEAASGDHVAVSSGRRPLRRARRRGRRSEGRKPVLAPSTQPLACADTARNTADLPQVEVRKAAVTPAVVGRWLGTADLVILDPSHDGAGRAVIAALAALDPGPRRMVYVSCDAASFARDLRVPDSELGPAIPTGIRPVPDDRARRASRSPRPSEVTSAERTPTRSTRWPSSSFAVCARRFPAQTPFRPGLSSAYARHSSATGQRAQMAAVHVAPEPSAGKNSSMSCPRQAA